MCPLVIQIQEWLWAKKQQSMKFFHWKQHQSRDDGLILGVHGAYLFIMLYFSSYSFCLDACVLHVKKPHRFSENRHMRCAPVFGLETGTLTIMATLACVTPVLIYVFHLKPNQVKNAEWTDFLRESSDLIRISNIKTLNKETPWVVFAYLTCLVAISQLSIILLPTS